MSRAVPTGLSRAARLLRAAAALLVVAAGCESTGEPRAIDGAYTVRLISPNGAEGAAVLELTGPGIASVTPLEGEVFSSLHEQATRALVLLTDPGEIRFRVELRGATVLPQARVVAVAGPEDQHRDLAGYRVELTP